MSDLDYLKEEAEYIAKQRDTLNELTEQHRTRLFELLKICRRSNGSVKKLLEIQKLTERTNDVY